MIYLLLLQQIIPLAYHLLSPRENRAGRVGQLWTGSHPRLPLSQRLAQRHRELAADCAPLAHSVCAGELTLVTAVRGPDWYIVPLPGL